MGPSDVVDIILLVDVVDIDDDVVGIAKDETFVTTAINNSMQNANEEDDRIAIVIGCRIRRSRIGK